MNFETEAAASVAAIKCGATRINFTRFASPSGDETWSRVIATRPGGTSHGGWTIVLEAIVQPPVADGWRDLTMSMDEVRIFMATPEPV